MLWVLTVKYMVDVNGSSVGIIIPSRSLRQGDPMFPYLFLFCIDGLFQEFSIEVNNGTISGYKISSNAPQETHLLFADDSLLFFLKLMGMKLGP